MPTLNATAFNDRAYVLVEANWTDQPTVTYAYVTRRNTVTGEIVTLRPHMAYDADGNLLLNCGLGLWWDTEPPLNVPLEYCTFAAPVQTALNANPGFETGVLPWVAVSGTLTQSALNVHSGAFSGRLVPNAIGVPAVRSLATYALTGGLPVTFSAWLFSTLGWNGAQLKMSYTLSDGRVQTQVSPLESLDDAEYRLVTTTFTPPLNATVTEVRVDFFGVPTGANIMHLDDFQVTQAAANTATACDTVTVVSESVWLKSPIFPCSDVEIGLCLPPFDECEDETRVSYAGTRDTQRSPNTVRMYPANRKFPIPESRQRRGPESELMLIAHDCDARDAVVDVCDPGTVLFFQAPAEYCIPDRYIDIGVLGEDYISIDQRETFRLMSLPYVEVARVEGPANGPCGTRIEDLCDIYTTWDGIDIGGLDWIDLPTGGASNNSPGDPPISSLRIWGTVEATFASWLAVKGGGTRDWGELRDGL